MEIKKLLDLMSLADGGQKHCCYWQNNFDFYLVDCLAFILFFCGYVCIHYVKKVLWGKEEAPEEVNSK